MTSATAGPEVTDPDLLSGNRTFGSKSGRPRPWLRYLVASALYLATSVALWWHVWTEGPSTVMTCDCTDAGRTVWYLNWSAFAVAHGHQLLYSDFLFHPAGLNLLTDTSVPAIGLILAPLTLVAGPVVTMNVASTLIPALTALSMFWLLQRWVRWTPAAFIGGLAYGFGTLAIVQLTFGWLNLACLALVPLIAACVDELLVRQRLRAGRVGVVLAVLITVEFFVSSETTLLLALAGFVSAVLILGYAVLIRPVDLRRRIGYVARGASVAGVVTLALLAYPAWLFVHGPSHLGGMVWSTNVPGNLGNAVANFWSPYGQYGPVSSQLLAQSARALGGYQGPAAPSPSYLGPGLLAVIVVGTVVWRADRRLWFFGALGTLFALLSLRVGGGHWGPWAFFDHLPLLDNVVQSRFDAVIGLCAAVMLAVIVDRTRSTLQRGMRPVVGRAERDQPERTGTLPPQWAGAVALAVAGVALVPTVVVLAPSLPLNVQPVTVPHWFQSAAGQRGPDRVLATYPFATADSQAAIPWQAISGMHYRMAGGGGPAGTVARAGANKTAFNILRMASEPLGNAPTLDAAALDAVRHALRQWGVTTVVVPDGRGLAAHQVGRGTAYGLGFYTAVMGSLPHEQAGAWVWNLPATTAPAQVGSSAFTSCTSLPPTSWGQVPACVLAHTSAST